MLQHTPSSIFKGTIAMSRDTTGLSEDLVAYIREVGMRQDPHLAALREETASHTMARMQISPEQGQFMTLLIKLMGARKTLEVGVFTGYSAMVVAKAMGPGGRVVALDVNAEYTAIARRHWQNAGVADRIDLRLAPAADSMKRMIQDGESGTYDFAFIDADKENYDVYYENALVLLRQGGLIAIDNVLWHGQVVDPSDTTPATTALRAISRKIHGDSRVEVSMIPIGDGLTLVLKR
jgi:caffeoyl-CoA O-methyltransferase